MVKNKNWLVTIYQTFRSTVECQARTKEEAEDKIKDKEYDVPSLPNNEMCKDSYFASENKL